jgi:hypothetical protein
MDYNLIPFFLNAQPEYSGIGISETKALSLYGKEVLNIFHSDFPTLETDTLPPSSKRASCYMKVSQNLN